MRPFDEPRDAADAARTERYLDALLAADTRHAPEVPVDVRLDPGIRLVARRLRADLVHVHPSFRFQEDLAARLNVVAGRMRDGLPAGVDLADGPAVAIAATSMTPLAPLAAFPYPAVAGDPAALPEAAPPARVRAPIFAVWRDGPAWPSMPAATLPARPLIVGGVASAAISLGAVYVAWRFSHPSEGAMTRAVRAAHAATAAAHAAQAAAVQAAVAATKVAS